MERSVAEVMLGQATPLFRERGVLNSRQVGRCSKNCHKPTLGVIEREEAADSVTVGCYKEDVVWSGVPPEVMRMSGHAAVTGGVVLYGPGGSHSTACGRHWPREGGAAPHCPGRLCQPAEPGYRRDWENSGQSQFTAAYLDACTAILNEGA